MSRKRARKNARKAKVGRPPKPPEERRERRITIRLTTAEKAEIEAKAAGSELAEWVRTVLLELRPRRKGKR